jgi:1-acyl-sn-glycerol-3-phosphate acyltransferase
MSISKTILRIFGWQTNGNLPPGVNQAVLIVAPHTSAWDFVIGRLTFFGTGKKFRFLIKKEAFFFPFGYFLKALGGVPVDRGRKNDMVTNVAGLFKNHENLVVVITPEGTRRLSKQWKKGFYLIAQAAGVPVALAFIDYGKKTGGIGLILHPSGDFEKDISVIYDFYRDKTARHPEKFFVPETHKQRTS